jgi:ComF family protein
MTINTEPVILADKKAKQYFTRAFAAFVYQEPVRGLILALKHASNGFAAEIFAPYMAAILLKEFGARLKDFTLVPVPLSKRRLRHRGYNQAELIANAVSAHLDIAVSRVVTRVKKTTPQVNMTVAQRAENVRSAFAVTDPKSVRGRRFIIIDDVITSGSTANEIARVLFESGAAEINILAAASANKA